MTGAGGYKHQVRVDDRQEMSSVHSLMWLRDRLSEGHPDLVAGMSVYDEDNNLWLPLHQVCTAVATCKFGIESLVASTAQASC